MEELNQAQDIKGLENSKDTSNASEALLLDLLAMGFDEPLCKEAVKYTNNQEKAIELIFQFQDDGMNPSNFQQEIQFHKIPEERRRLQSRD